MEGGYSGVTKVKFRSETVSLVKLAVYSNQTIFLHLPP